MDEIAAILAIRRRDVLRARGHALAACFPVSRARGWSAAVVPPPAGERGVAARPRRPDPRSAPAGGRARPRESRHHPTAARDLDHLGAAARLLPHRPGRHPAPHPRSRDHRRRACRLRPRRGPGSGPRRCSRLRLAVGVPRHRRDLCGAHALRRPRRARHEGGGARRDRRNPLRRLGDADEARRREPPREWRRRGTRKLGALGHGGSRNHRLLPAAALVGDGSAGDLGGDRLGGEPGRERPVGRARPPGTPRQHAAVARRCGGRSSRRRAAGGDRHYLGFGARLRGGGRSAWRGDTEIGRPHRVSLARGRSGE